MSNEQHFGLQDLDVDLHAGDFDTWYEAYLANLAAKRLRRENPYVADIAKELLLHPSGLHCSRVIDRMEAARRARGHEIPRSFAATVRCAYNRHCVDSLVYQKRGAPPDEGIFYSPAGKGLGYWAVDHQRVLSWFAAWVRL
jgi:hypothetical protein